MTDLPVPVSQSLTGTPLPGTGPFASVFAPVAQFLRQPMIQRALPAISISTALGIAAMAYFAMQSAPQVPVFTGLADADKAAIADALQTSGLNHSIDSGTGAVMVDADQLQQARILLAGQGLPKAKPSADSLIASLPMGSSRAIEDQALQAAREADLARTIEGIDAVSSARVHLAISEPSVFVRDSRPTAASVMLTLLPGRSLAAAQVRAMRYLVASSVPGLDAEQVSVIDQSGALLSADADNGDMAAFQLQTRIEDRLRQSVVSLLAPMLGMGNFSVEVHADVDMSESQATRETYPKDDRALRSEEGNRSTETGATGKPAIGIPGALSNQPPPDPTLSNRPGTGPVATTPADAPASNETFSRSFDVGREISVTHQPQGRLNRLSVAVALSQAKGKKAISATEMTKIESLVKGAVGYSEQRGDIVAIGQRAFVQTEKVDLPMWNQTWFLPLARQVGAVLVALLAFLFFGRPIMRAVKRRTQQRELTEAAIEETLLTSTNLKAVAPKTGGQEITLEMIEAAPSYEARANLVRAFVQQDSARAAQVVRHLMLENSHAA